MAASAKDVVGASDESSSSDDEELKRCQEAVWETRSDKKKDNDSSVKQSKRVVIDDHEHDGNELQVTKGFRTHVAKKLGHFLDSCITELQTKTSSCEKSANCDDADDEGFRLFSTSVPGNTAEDFAVPVRRRPVPSSSDSDSEMETRLREAAVSVKDLLPSSVQPYTALTATKSPCSEKTSKRQEMTEGEENGVVKKKKKKKRKHNQEEGENVDSLGSSLNNQSNGEHGLPEQEHTQLKKKRKKKQKQKESAEEEA